MTQGIYHRPGPDIGNPTSSIQEFGSVVRGPRPSPDIGNGRAGQILEPKSPDIGKFWVRRWCTLKGGHLEIATSTLEVATSTLEMVTSTFVV